MLASLFGTFGSLVQAQNTGILKGTISDSTNGEALPFSNVFIQEINRGASTNANGYFVIPGIPAPQEYILIVSYVGYQTKKINVKVQPNKVTEVNIGLSQSSVSLQTIEKIGERTIQQNATDLGLQRITVKDLEMLPKGVETDIFRSLQYLPGVQSTGDVSARYYVRGSPSNENLVLINGTTIYNPFHAFGIFSVIDPDMINSVEFYKGGFTTEFGQRLSSVLNIITKDGNKNRISAQASSSFLTGKGLIEGPIPYGSFMVTGRKSFSTQILQKFLNDEAAPINFYDGSFKLNYSNPNFIKGSNFSINGFFSGDKLLNDNPTIEDIEWYNNVIGFKWSQTTDSPLYYEMGLSYSNFSGSIKPKLSGAYPEDNSVDDISYNLDLHYIYDSKDELGVGIALKNINTELYLKNSSGAVSNLSAQGTSISIYAKYKFLRFTNFGADFGTRLDPVTLSSSEASTYLFEPRLSLTYVVFPGITLKSAWGLYQQELTTLSDENQVISLFEPWIITPSYLKPGNAIHYTVGLDANFANYFNINIQGYYKVLQNIATLNDQKFTSDQKDLLPASGESYGWEFQFKYLQNPISFSGSYSLGWAYKNLDGWLYYPRYDNRHSVSLLLGVDLGKGWDASATWIFNSGLPFTQNMGYYDKYHFTDFYSNWKIYEGYIPYALLADKNLGRLPSYHRLDLTLSKDFTLDFLDVSVDLSVLNVYDRKNIFYFKRDSGERVNMLPILPTATLKIKI